MILTRIYLRTSDIQTLRGLNPKTASREMMFIRTLLGKKKLYNKTLKKSIWQPVTIREYAEIMDVDENEIREALQP